jgi:DNA-directed RNA polymerase subunit RPC12/RpoP
MAAVEAGNKNLAWSLLNQAAQMDPLDPTPWLLLTETTDDPDEEKDYLEQALAADPENFKARRGLTRLTGGNLEEPTAFSPDVMDVVPSSEEPLDAEAREIFLCPKCGAGQEFNLQFNALICNHCGFITEPEERSTGDQEQYLRQVLPTESGHRWAAVQQNLACGQCGAHSLWPPGQASTVCPYCGSHQLIASEENDSLIDPQAIAIMRFDENEAVDQIVEWLGKGWTAPDDLKESARKSNLRPAYYPFWTFDGTLKIQWVCEVNESSNNSPRWVGSKGVEFEMFDDVLIPGLKALPLKELNQLGHYNLKDLVKFKPEYLAGWPALTYDRSLAQGALLAREQVIKKVRRELQLRVLPGQQKQNLHTGNVSWRGMTFKYVLLPVWIGMYRYKGREFRVILNGQTGIVAGEKPRDTLKLAGIILSAIMTLVVLILFGALIASSLGWFSF